VVNRPAAHLLIGVLSCRFVSRPPVARSTSPRARPIAHNYGTALQRVAPASLPTDSNPRSAATWRDGRNELSSTPYAAA